MEFLAAAVRLITLVEGVFAIEQVLSSLPVATANAMHFVQKYICICDRMKGVSGPRMMMNRTAAGGVCGSHAIPINPSFLLHSLLYVGESKLLCNSL